LDHYLAARASSWNGAALSAAAETEIVDGFSTMKAGLQHFYYTSATMCIGAAVFPLFLVLVNLVLASFVLTIRHNIRVQLVHFPTLASNGVVTIPGQISISPADAYLQTGENVEPLSFPASPILPSPSSPFSIAPSSIPVSPPTPVLSRSPTRPVVSVSIDPTTNSPLRTTRFLPTRSHVRAIADDPELAVAGSSSHLHADRISALMKAEIELLVIGLSVVGGALALAVTCAWSVTVFRDWENMGWAKQEAVLTLPIWVLGVGLVVGEGLHAWVEWKYVVGRWWRIERYANSKERKESDAAARPSTSGNRNGPTGSAIATRSLGFRPSFLRSKTTDSARSARGGGASQTGGFDGAIEVAIEVTQKEEVEIELQGEEDVMDTLSYRSARTATEEEDKTHTARRKEVWEE
jgi:hypothetical protein